MLNPISLVNSLQKDILDITVETLLVLMAWCIDSSHYYNPLFPDLEGYYRNVENFEAVYVFSTEDGEVQTTAKFQNGMMTVEDLAESGWDLKIVFRDATALWKLMLSGGTGVVDAMMANDTQVYGNLNHLYKFGFLIKDLVGKRLGIPLPA